MATDTHKSQNGSSVDMATALNKNQHGCCTVIKTNNVVVVGALSAIHANMADMSLAFQQISTWAIGH